VSKEHVIIGDIHGCIDELNELLTAINYKSPSLQLVFAGDYIHRGPDSISCIRRVRELCGKYNAKAILGNHENSQIRHRSHEVRRVLTGKPNPMKPLNDRDKEIQKNLTEDDVEWMRNLPLKVHLRDTWWALHGGLEPAYTLENQSPNQIIRCRYINPETGRAVPLNKNKTQPVGSVYWTNMWNGPESIVYGHCVHSLYAPIIDIKPNGVKCIGIDTGCVFGGFLTGYLLERNEIVRVKAKREYFPINFKFEDEEH
jgi:bis(5'-nucleosyl)-tetraphosphatase (symmetrical)